MCIWSINDNSDHRQLLQFNLKIKEQTREIRKKPLRILPNDDCPSISMDLPNDVLQLRTFEGIEGKVFLRTKRSLELANPSEVYFLIELKNLRNLIFLEISFYFIQNLYTFIYTNTLYER
jgi:hypothetical protein